VNLGSPDGSDPGFSGEACGAQHCITCGDDGIPMTVVLVDEDRGLALCEDADGTRSSVEIALVGAVGPDDTLLVHAGTALTRLEHAA
jgi:hydrogenase maturation factor